LTLPAATPVTRPVLLIEARPEFELDQVTELVMLAVLASE